MPEDIIDLCPKCGWEVFQYTTINYKCVQAECEWIGKDPMLKLRRNYDR